MQNDKVFGELFRRRFATDQDMTPLVGALVVSSSVAKHLLIAYLLVEVVNVQPGTPTDLIVGAIV